MTDIGLSDEWNLRCKASLQESLFNFIWFNGDYCGAFHIALAVYAIAIAFHYLQKYKRYSSVSYKMNSTDGGKIFFV